MTRATKDSGVEWIGQIPERWHLTRIAGLYNLRNTKVSDKDFPALSVTNKGILPQLETAAKTNAGDNRKLVCIGDFAINSRSDRRGSCGISPYNGSVSLINLVLTPRNKTIPKYFDWLFHTVQFADEFYRWGHGIVDDLWSTGWEEMKKILVPLPPLPEQQAIADYLDDKCAQIDNITATINEQIEVLKQYKKSIITEAVTKGLDPNSPMKDSGVEWIGQIPEHWKVVRLKYLAAFNPPINNVDLNKEISYMPMECLKNGYMIPHTKLFADLVNGLTGFYEGDIVMAKVTPCFENGNIAIAQNLVNNIGYGSTEIYVFRCNKILTKFLFYYLQNELFKNKAKSTMMGTGGLKRVSSQFTKNLSVLFPPLSEQQAIADYLDDKCTKIDAVIADKHAQLETLAAYKKSLIYEYVTGKKSVPGFEEA